MSFRSRAGGGKKGVANRALYKDGTLWEARDIWAVGLTKEGWTCVDEKCRAKMIPCAWTYPDADGQFHDKDGRPFKPSPYFRAEPDHHPDCAASHPSWPHAEGESTSHLGPPADYPSRVILLQHPQSASTNGQPVSDPEADDTIERKHAHWVRSIREACEFFVSHPHEHWRPLRVDLCAGARTYAECFVRFGTGGSSEVGKHRVFYDELRLFGSRVDIDADSIRLDLLGGIHDQPRTLIIRTSDWLPGHRRELQNRLRMALREARAAFHQRSPERAWIFAVTQERFYDEAQLEVDLQPGVDVLLCAMPPLKWRFRPSHQFPRRRSHPTDGSGSSFSADEGTARTDQPAQPGTVNHSGGTTKPEAGSAHPNEGNDGADQPTAKVLPSEATGSPSAQPSSNPPQPTNASPETAPPTRRPVRRTVREPQTLRERLEAARERVAAAVANGARRLSLIFRLRG